MSAVLLEQLEALKEKWRGEDHISDPNRILDDLDEIIKNHRKLLENAAEVAAHGMLEVIWPWAQFALAAGVLPLEEVPKFLDHLTKHMEQDRDDILRDLNAGNN